jgi:hypothetical protein
MDPSHLCWGNPHEDRCSGIHNDPHARWTGHAADKIALICSDAKGKDDYSLSIDLDRKLASFHMSDLPDADGIPVTRVTENYVWFQNKALAVIYSQGKLDRITGSLHFFHRHLNNAKDLYLTCKPAKSFLTVPR